MGDPPNHEWVTLREFDDPRLAGDVITSILSMEFEAILVDLADNSIVAGSPEVEPSSGELTDRPLELRPKLPVYDAVLGLGPPTHSMPPPGRSEEHSWGHERDGGPWRLMVPPDIHGELEPILQAIIDEQQKFDADHDQRRRVELRIMRYFLFGGLVLVAMVIGILLLLRVW